MIEHDGVQYARVTSDILAPFSNFDGITKEILDRKARIGTNVHLAISHHIEGGSFVLGPEEQPYYESFLKWKEFAKPEFIFAPEERFYWKEKRVTGCPDVVAVLGGWEYVLIDWKTSSGESRIVWPMQGHIYHAGMEATSWKESDLRLSQRILFIKLDPYGELPRVFQYKINQETMSKCMKAIDDFWSTQSNGLAEIGRSS